MRIFYIFIAASFSFPSWGQLNTTTQYGTQRSGVATFIRDSVNIDRIDDTISLTGDKQTDTKRSTKISPPLNVIQITSGYGLRKHPVIGGRRNHNGVDLRSHYAAVFSIADGVVIQSATGVLEGNYLVIAHGVIHSIYCHLDASFVKAGQAIRAGEAIGISGNTGVTSGPHLHFGLKHKNRFIDPEPFLRLFMVD